MNHIMVKLMTLLIVSLSCTACGLIGQKKTPQEKTLTNESLQLEWKRLHSEREQRRLEQNQQTKTIKQSNTLKPQPITNQEMCTTLYYILQGCYQQGKGNKVDICADLTFKIAENFSLSFFKDNPKILASFSLMCGKACAYGSQDQNFPSFVTFKKDICP